MWREWYQIQEQARKFSEHSELTRIAVIGITDSTTSQM
jgi:hypothetical protein